jgi:hypothetical protein
MGEGGKMQLDMNPFPVGMVELAHRKILVWSSQADTTKGKNVIVSDDFRNKMMKLHSPEVGIWKENVGRRSAQRVKPTSDMLIKKYLRQQQDGVYIRQRKRSRSPGYRY